MFDVSALLRGYGWQVPAYTMPDDATDIAVLRMVVREGFSANLARALRDDLVEVLAKLDKVGSRRLRRRGAFRPLRARLGQSAAVINTADMTQNEHRASPSAVVDLDAIAHNVATLREHAGSAAVMAVVKADGYGHGATPVARAALAAGAAELGVATVDEALALRRDGITAPVLAWLHLPHTDFGSALLADVEVAVSSEREVDDSSTPCGAPAGPRRSPSRWTPA